MEFVLDCILEFLFEFVLEGILHLTVGNPKLKTWIKTVFFLIFSESVAGLFLWLGVADTGSDGSWVCKTIGLCLGIGSLPLGFWGHQRDWKQV